MAENLCSTVSMETSLRFPLSILHLLNLLVVELMASFGKFSFDSA